jgi:hypothetical protein
MRDVRHQERKKMCQGHHDINVSFMRMFTDVTGISPERRKDDACVGYSGQAALWRE